MSRLRATRLPSHVATGGTLDVDLFAPGMTALHRVGLAGLAMTLLRLESTGESAETRRLRELGTWSVEERRVRLTWAGDGAAFLGALLRASFRLSDEGLVWLPALGDPLDHPGPAVVLHQALLGTFLQHGKHRSARRGDGAGPGSVSVEVDGESLPLRYLPLASYVHQSAPVSLTEPLEVRGWLYPGGVVRHNLASGETSLAESPSRALALLYAPVGAIYFEVRRATVGVRPEHCLVLPAVTDLRAYAEVRRLFLRQGVERLQVAGTAEAAVRVLAELAARDLLDRAAADACTALAFGTVPWSKQQKTRVERLDVAGVGRPGLTTYRAATHLLPARLARSKPDPKTGEVQRWWVAPQVPDLVAQNVAAGAPWWRGFADLWGRARAAMPAKQRHWALRDEREGLSEMVRRDETMPDGPEARLVRACHTAWRRRLGALSERSRRQGLRFGDLVDREHERVRISFARCKSAAMLRQTLTDFWSRAGGPLPELQDGWPELLPLLNERWRDARDLALLALASYASPAEEQQETGRTPNGRGTGDSAAESTQEGDV